MIVTDLTAIARQAVQNHDDYESFRYYVEDDEHTDADLDLLVEELARPIIAAIDCTQCANCCRSLDVYLTPSDAERLAEGLLIPISEIQTQYINTERAQQEGEWGVFEARPCAFLKGNHCGVYPHRPESCHAYPEFTPDFRWQLEHILGGVGLCPIIYNVIEAVKKELRW
jgi:uncharacterized protein